MKITIEQTTLLEKLGNAWIPCFLWGMLLAGPAVLAYSLVPSPVARQRWMQAIYLIWISGSLALVARMPEFQVSGHGTPWLGIAWCTGVAIFAILNLTSLFKSWRRSGLNSYPEANVWDWFRSERSKVGAKKVSIRVCGDLKNAMAACRYRMVLVSPDFPAHMTESEARSILRHEIVHAKSNHWLQWAGELLVSSVLFWHPLAWWMAGAQRESREMECDDVAAKPDRLSYAQALLKVHDYQRSVALAFTGACTARWARLTKPAQITHRQRLISSCVTAFALLAAGWISMPLFSVNQSSRAVPVNMVQNPSLRPEKVIWMKMTSSAASSSQSSGASTGLSRIQMIGKSSQSSSGRTEVHFQSF